MGGSGQGASVRAFLDTNILVRHLTGDPPDQATRATRLLREATALFLPDLVLAEVVYVLQSFYEVPRTDIAVLAKSVLGFRNVVTVDPAVLLRTIEIYETDRLAFADAYVIARAEASGTKAVVSFDKGIDRVETVERVEPA